MNKYFNTISPQELRKIQLKSAKKRVENQNIRCKLAAELYNNNDIQTVMSVLRVKRRMAYTMIKKGKEL